MSQIASKLILIVDFAYYGSSIGTFEYVKLFSKNLEKLMNHY